MQRDSWLQWALEQPWAIEILIISAFLALLNIFLKRAITQLQRKAKLKENDWRYHLDYAALTPTRILLWILLLSAATDLITRTFQLGGIFTYLPAIRNTGIIFCMAWFLLRWKNVIHRAISSHPNRKTNGQFTIDPFTLEVGGKLFTILVFFISLLIIMQLFGLDIVPLITFGGIGAATLGFAGKDAIANFFGGLMIYLTRPFMIGDLIELPDKKILGYVEEIGWYLTSVRDMQKRPIYVPNATFSTEALINQSRMTHRRIEESLSIRYADVSKIPKILEKIHSLIEHHTSIDQHQPIYIFLQNFAPASIQLEFKVYVLHTRYDDFMEIRQELLLQIYRIVESEGAQMPIPTMQILLEK